MESGIENNIRRLEYIDIAKAIGLILVIISHSVAPHYSYWAGSFFIPIFFILSGYTLRSLNIKQKAKRLLLPYVVFNCLIVGIMYISGLKELTINNLWGIIYSRFALFPLDSSHNIVLMNIGNSPTWFLTAMFITFCLYVPFAKWPKYRTYFAVTYLLTTIALEQLPVLLPWSIDTSFFLCVLLYIGTLVRQYDIINKPWWVYGVLGILYIIVASYSGYINISVRDYGYSVLLLLVGGTLGSLITIKLCKAIEHVVIGRGLSIVGKHTLTIFCLQMPLLFIAEELAQLLRFSEIEYLMVLFQLIFTLGIGYIVSVILKRFIPNIV